MQVPFVDLKSQYDSIKTDIDSAISAVIKETNFIGGQPVKEFEKAFSTMLGCKNTIGVANGTDAIYIALKMLGIGQGDEVIVPAMSWISTSETVTQTGAKPVFVDIDKNTFTIDPELIEEKITPNTKAIIPVHLYGHIAHINAIKLLCKRHNLFLIEDCAQSHFSEEDGIFAGRFGDVGTFSFYPGKNLGAYGDAGAIVTDSDSLAEKMRMYANHGALKKHEHQMEGINSRLDTIQASILLAKSKHIMKWTEDRIRNAARYSSKLGNLDGLIIPSVRKGTKHSFHLYVVRSKRRNELKDFLNGRGVHTAIHYPTALPNLPAYSYLQQNAADFPIASRYQGEILSLPMYPELQESQIDFVCEQIKSFFGQG